MEKHPISQVLPSDIIIYDILTRVPPTSLVRFRCVCKCWYNLFTHNPLFVSLHYQKCDNSTSSGYIGVTKDHALVFINPRDKKETVLPSLGNEIVIGVQQSFNGFLLLCCKSPNRFVFNPITRSAFNIPKPINDLDEGPCHFGLCYDPIVKKHKVVFCGPFKNRPARKVKYLTVEEGLGEEGGCDNVLWRDIVVPSTFELPNGRYIGSCSCFCLNDSLYWTILPYSDLPYLLALDISREIFYRTKLPVQHVHANIVEMGGVLCLSHHNCQTNEFKIWALKKKNPGYDEDDHEWVVKFNIDLNWSMKNLQSSDDLHRVFCNGWKPFAILSVPKLKVLFRQFYVDKQGDIKGWSHYSYDVELKQLEFIHFPTKERIHWHVHSIGYC